jgi:2,4-dienoyl-CoA reductase-like NADH-dependent reductase (Old Yellow Enzyme family)
MFSLSRRVAFVGKSYNRRMTDLFSPFTLRSVTLRNRIGVSPMCQYSYVNGIANDWTLVHLGSRAAGGAGLVIVEATAVEACGRISPADMGIWTDDHIAPLARVARFVSEQGSVPGIQIAHAGRKASTAAPWDGGGPMDESEGGWQPMAPSPLPFKQGWKAPREMTIDDVRDVRRAFVDATRRSNSAGFRWLELHAAHGYLLHSFLSPLSNQRRDEYGGSFDNRIRLLLEIAREVRAAWPAELPLTVRLSCSDWVEGGWTSDDSVELSRRLKALGVDLIDCSSGGLVPHAKIPAEPGYQVHFAEAIRSGAQIATAAVGLIVEPKQADDIIRSGQADIVLLARQMLRDPYWPIRAAHKLGRPEAVPPPRQYARAF